MANLVAEGIKEIPGVQPLVRTVPELIPKSVVNSREDMKAGREMQQDVPLVTMDDFREAGAIAFGTPTRFGNVAAQLKNEIDQLTSLWLRGELEGKPAGVFVSTGDPARLQQVVWNLLSNAVKFTPQGGRVEVGLERVDPYICIAVSDTGKGIIPDFLPYVFDRFTQADASSARRYGGLGLGLALVKYLVELHGGTIEVSSAGEGQGATFKVTLPVRAVTTPLGEAGGESVTVKSSGELAGVRALVVDDDDDARELIERALTQYGAGVVAVSSAAEAYALIAATPPQERPDIMVTDIGMPGEDGYSLMRRVRELERERNSYTPAVALTAYGRTEDRIQALMAGFQTHIVKPVDPAELAAVITSLIRRPMAPR